MSEHRPGPTQRRRDRPRSARWALRLAYEGATFHGFQRQPGQPTIEGALVEALVGLGLTGGLSFASRTDAGVHAEGQVVAFRSPETLSAAQLHEGLAARLAPGLRVVELRPAPPRFHPRWSATGKTYRYTLAPAPAARAWHVEGLDPVQLEQALVALRKAPRLDGFTAAGAPPKAAPPLAGLTLERDETRWTMTFVGEAFRRYAIRHMVGLAVDVARGLAPLEAISRAAEAPPPYRGTRAPGDGLTLVAVHYPEGLDPFATDH
jgi:tRNA pseudouridine38-40 synthase